MSVLKISVVIPCYNEGILIKSTAATILDYMNELARRLPIDKNFEILFVDDGSKDETWKEIKYLTESGRHFKGVKLSKNFGHQAALLAGIYNTSGDAVISLDADLQDDINVIEEMIKKHISGIEIVFGVRYSRGKDGFFKKWSAAIYYKLLKFMGVNIIEEHADFRLMGKKSIAELEKFQERNIFLRGIIPLIGFSSDIVKYERKNRLMGRTKYSLKKMLQLAFNGISGFSDFPLKIISLIGAIISGTSIILSLFFLYQKTFGRIYSTPGWASTVIPMYFLGGLQMLSLGVIGLYISKIFEEVKSRPRFIIEEISGNE